MYNFKTADDIIAYFNNNETRSRKFLEQIRWGGKITCPKCGSSDKIYRYSDQKTLRCSKCDRKFTAKSGTIFEKSLLPLNYWLRAMVYCKTDVSFSAKQLQRKLGLNNYNSAHRMRSKIRHLSKVDWSKMEKLLGTIEWDLKGIGADPSKMSEVRKALLLPGTGSVKQKSINAFLVRNYGLFGFPCQPYMKAEQLRSFAYRYFDQQSSVYTDSAKNFLWTKKHFAKTWHVNHKKDKYGGGKVHTNTVEGAFGNFEKSIKKFNGISLMYYINYWDDFCWEYNANNFKGLRNNEVGKFFLALEDICRPITVKQMRAEGKKVAKITLDWRKEYMRKWKERRQRAAEKKQLKQEMENAIYNEFVQLYKEDKRLEREPFFQAMAARLERWKSEGKSIWKAIDHEDEPMVTING